MINPIILFFLRRKLFKGQFRLFSWLYANQWLKVLSTTTKPLIGNFNIKVNTKNYIDACIYYMGDYEPYLKTQFNEFIKQGDTVLDVGANIGFHTLYFAELVGEHGKVYAIEPIKNNFDALGANINLNNFQNINKINKAFGSKTESIAIHLDLSNSNPGSFSLTEPGEKNTTIECIKGDDFISSQDLNKIDFIKVDVEGFEFEVLKGLSNTIMTYRPVIVFEYDRNYQLRGNQNPKDIFEFLINRGYHFYQIDGYGVKSEYTYSVQTMNAEILAVTK